MDSRNVSEETEHRLGRIGGALVAIGATGIVVAIILYLTSGAVAPPGASGSDVAAALATAAWTLPLSAYLSVPVDLALLVGAGLLAARASTAAHVRAAWAAVAAATLLVVQFDLLLPRGLIPLAEDYAAAPSVFEALYFTSNFTHSVGLFATFASLIVIFTNEVYCVSRAVPRAVAVAAVALWCVGLVVSVTLILERPLVMLAPSILVGWSLTAFLGLRLARGAASPAPVGAEAARAEA